MPLRRTIASGDKLDGERSERAPSVHGGQHLVESIGFHRRPAFILALKPAARAAGLAHVERAHSTASRRRSPT